MTLLNCEVCGKQFEGTCGKFCSAYCRTRDWNSRNKERWQKIKKESESRRVARRNGMSVAEWKKFLKTIGDIEKQCPGCQKFFKSPHYGAKYCSAECSGKCCRIRMKQRGYKPKYKRPAKGSNRHIGAVIRTRIHAALKRNHKTFRTMNVIGCSIQELKAHIESQFHKDMTWENHGKQGWHIDHKRPCASFDLSKPEEQKACFHYSNLQPLWWDKNIKKGDKWDGQTAMTL